MVNIAGDYRNDSDIIFDVLRRAVDECHMVEMADRPNNPQETTDRKRKWKINERRWMRDGLQYIVWSYAHHATLDKLCCMPLDGMGVN